MSSHVNGNGIFIIVDTLVSLLIQCLKIKTNNSLQKDITHCVLLFLPMVELLLGTDYLVILED